ncbi:hypothetical protein GCM10010320_30460 [Streptomyces caelestis]|uniref:DNA-binding transcriptional LysR family regulator n=1 Tax=Streptomyces caelestis TaxID=36816 RepID=A0A7W9HBT9_9ACTN|nr:DNA-binding transcriptional LysR family regulator [Streptomyces caelestis]GGW47903.1 hypothetical protein GCM10010320_30460 [Streptomyces caelestis]
MDIRQLEYFLAIVDRGGFNRAASALYVSQPSLSQTVRALERDLGSELFHRIGRRAVLTEAGRGQSAGLLSRRCCSREGTSGADGV